MIRLATPCDTNRHEMPPILGSNCSSYCSTWAGDPRDSFWRLSLRSREAHLVSWVFRVSFSKALLVLRASIQVSPMWVNGNRRQKDVRTRLSQRPNEANRVAPAVRRAHGARKGLPCTVENSLSHSQPIRGALGCHRQLSPAGSTKALLRQSTVRRNANAERGSRLLAGTARRSISATWQES